MDNAKESAGPGPGGALDKYTIKDPEAFARNLARMTEYLGKAAANWVSAREKGDASDAYSDSVADVVRTMSKVSEYWLSDPRRALEAQTSLFTGYMNLWSNSIRRLSGEATPDVVETDKSDKRFGDPEWRENAFYDFLRQTYLLTANWANSLVENAEGLDEHTRHKAGFYVKQIANAVAPSNFLVTNPEVFKETIATNGENLVKGMRMLAEDIDAGHGELKIRQADYSKFAVGVNMALTPGKVVAQSDIA